MPDRANTDILEQIAASITRGRSKETERLTQKALAEGHSADTILKNVLIPAMRNIGTDFMTNEDDIPRVLSAARSMQKGLNVLEPYLGESNDMHIGTAVLGTVEGDLHEVGKNLVAIMLRCAGIDVIDLGVDVPERAFVKALREHPEAQVVCISSLLSTSLRQMQGAIRAIRQDERTANRKILVGGGSVTESLARKMGADAYTENAAEAAEAAKQFILFAKEDAL